MMIRNRPSGLWLQYNHLVEICDRADEASSSASKQTPNLATSSSAAAEPTDQRTLSGQSLETSSAEQHLTEEAPRRHGVINNHTAALHPLFRAEETKMRTEVSDGVDRSPESSRQRLPQPEKSPVPSVSQTTVVPTPKPVLSHPSLPVPMVTSAMHHAPSRIAVSEPVPKPLTTSVPVPVAVSAKDAVQTPIPVTRPAAPTVPTATPVPIVPVPRPVMTSDAFRHLVESVKHDALKPPPAAPAATVPVSRAVVTQDAKQHLIDAAPRPPSAPTATATVPRPIVVRDAKQHLIASALRPLSACTAATVPVPHPVVTQNAMRPLKTESKNAMPESLPVAMLNAAIPDQRPLQDRFLQSSSVISQPVTRPPTVSGTAGPTPHPMIQSSTSESLPSTREESGRSQAPSALPIRLSSTQVPAPVKDALVSSVPLTAYVQHPFGTADNAKMSSSTESETAMQMPEMERPSAMRQPVPLANLAAPVTTTAISVSSSERVIPTEKGNAPVGTNSPNLEPSETSVRQIPPPARQNSASSAMTIDSVPVYMETENLSAEPDTPNGDNVVVPMASTSALSSRSIRDNHSPRFLSRSSTSMGTSILPEPIVAEHSTRPSYSRRMANDRNVTGSPMGERRTPSRSPRPMGPSSSRVPMRGRGQQQIARGWGNRMPSAGRETQYGTGYGLRRSNASRPVDPPSLDPFVNELLRQIVRAPSMTDSERVWEGLIERAQAYLKEGFSGVMEYTMTSTFGTLWLEAIKIKPPWLAKDLLELFTFHRRVLFAQLVSRQLMELIQHFKDFLRDVLKEQQSAEHALKVISLTKEVFGMYRFERLKDMPGPSIGLIVENAITFDEANRALQKGKADVQLLFDECVHEIQSRIDGVRTSQLVRSSGRGRMSVQGRSPGRGYSARASRLDSTPPAGNKSSIQDAHTATPSSSSQPPEIGNPTTSAGGEAMAWIRNLMMTVAGNSSSGYEMLKFVQSMVEILVRDTHTSASVIAANPNRVSVLNRVLQTVYQILMALIEMHREKEEKVDTVHTAKTVLTGMKDFITLVRLDAHRFCRKLQMPDERFLDEFKGKLTGGKEHPLLQMVSVFDQNYRALYSVVTQN